jgi:hypothetical protein
MHYLACFVKQMIDGGNPGPLCQRRIFEQYHTRPTLGLPTSPLIMPNGRIKKGAIPQCFEESPQQLGIINYTAQ